MGVESGDQFRKILAAEARARTAQRQAERDLAKAERAADEAAKKATKAAAEAAAKKAAEEEVARLTVAKAAAQAHAAELGRIAAADAEASEAHSRTLMKVEHDLTSGARHRAAAHEALEVALAARDAQKIAEALATARAAGVGTPSSVRLAESLIEPVHLLRDRGPGLEDYLSLPAELRGLSPEAAQEAELRATEGLNRQQLEGRVVELSRSLAMGRLHAKARLEQALLSRLEEADMASIRELGEALQDISAKRTVLVRQSLEKLEQDLLVKQYEAVREVERDTAAEMQELMLREEAALQSEADEVITEARCQHIPSVVSFRRGLAEVEDVLSHDAKYIQRARAYNDLSVAVLNFEDAVLAGRAASAELEALNAAAQKSDEFAERLLRQLPEACVKLCQREKGVPTEHVLRQQLAAKVDELAATALVPPDSGLLGELVGWALRQCYILEPRALPWRLAGKAVSPATAEAARNLEALSSSVAVSDPHGSRGSQGLVAAVARLETGLAGLCQERAADWLAEARNVLLLRQVIHAVKARAQCLSTTAA